MLGIEFPAYQKLWRLAGVDQIHVNGIQNKFWESDESRPEDTIVKTVDLRRVRSDQHVLTMKNGSVAEKKSLVCDILEHWR